MVDKQEEFSSLQLFALIYKHKILVLSFVGLATITSIIISFLFLKNEFKSTINVVPPQTQDALQSTLGMISSPLKDFGLSKLAGKSLSDNYNFIVILESQSVSDSIIKEFDLIKVYEIEKNSMADAREEFLSNFEVNYEKDGNYFISVWDKDPQRAAKMANRIVEIANNVAIRIFREEVRLNRENMDYRLFSADSTLAAIADTLQKFSSRTLIFSPDEQAKSIAQTISTLKAQEISYDILNNYYSKIYGENDYMTKSIAALQEEIKKQSSLSKSKPGFVGNFALKDAAKEGVEYLRLYTEYETYSKVKAFLLPAMEQNKIDEGKLIKNLIVIDAATPAEKKDRPRRSLIVAGTFLGSFVLMVLLIVLSYSFKDAKLKLKELNSNVDINK